MRYFASQLLKKSSSLKVKGFTMTARKKISQCILFNHNHIYNSKFFLETIYTLNNLYYNKMFKGTYTFH